MYFADCDNHVVRKIDTSGIISTFAGTGTYGYNGDGIAATAAQLYYPSDVQADDSNNIYISDGSNFRIRKVNKAGIISTYAGNGSGAYIGDGMAATNAQFSPNGIKFDHDGNLFISDGGPNRRVYMVDHSSNLFYVVAGNGVYANGGDNGPATAASFAGYLLGLAFDPCGNLYIGNITSAGDSDLIRKITYDALCSIATLNTNTVRVAIEVSIYPNPTDDQITIASGKKIVQIVVCNLTGQSLFEERANAETINVDLTSLSPGMYLVAILDEENNKTFRKVVKQ